MGYLLSTLILMLCPLGRTANKSIAPASISGGVSSVTASGGDILCKQKIIDEY